MEKKNKFVSTIGFNCNDPDHVAVAEFLNGMKRGKAQYIVDAVLAYQRPQQGDNSPPAGRLDYEQLRAIVLQVINEHEREKETADVTTAVEGPIPKGDAAEQPEELLAGFSEDTLQGIMDSLNAFKGEG